MMGKFHEACKIGDIKTVRKYLSHKNLNVNEKDNDGSTPFSLACCNGHKEIVELLLMCYDIIVPDVIETKNDKIKE